jgi:hypothetical protein
MAASTSSAGEDFAALHQLGQIQRVGLRIGSRKLSVISAMTLCRSAVPERRPMAIASDQLPIVAPPLTLTLSP